MVTTFKKKKFQEEVVKSTAIWLSQLEILGIKSENSCI